MQLLAPTSTALHARLAQGTRDMCEMQHAFPSARTERAEEQRVLLPLAHLSASMQGTLYRVSPVRTACGGCMRLTAYSAFTRTLLLDFQLKHGAHTLIMQSVASRHARVAQEQIYMHAAPWRADTAGDSGSAAAGGRARLVRGRCSSWPWCRVCNSCP